MIFRFPKIQVRQPIILLIVAAVALAGILSIDRGLAQSSSSSVVYLPLMTRVDGRSVYYLSPTGDDSRSGISESEAWATFDRVFQELKPGDTLLLMDGVYYQSLWPMGGGEPGNPITIKAQHDGMAVIDGQGVRIPVNLEGWRGASYYVIEGIVARNSSGSVYRLTADHNILRRVSGYDAYTDGNEHVFIIWADHTLLEDCIAAGTGRKMILIFMGEYNTVRRCFADWQSWDGRQWHDAWPWGDGIEIYNGNYNIIENSISYSRNPTWSISLLAQGSPPQGGSVGNKILGTMAIMAGMNEDGSVRYWGCPSKPEPCDPSDRPQPTQYTLIRDFDWQGQRAGFHVYEMAEVRDNLFQDILAWGNAGLGIAWNYSGNPNSGNNRVVRATLFNNGLDNPCGPYPCGFGGLNTDALQVDLSRFDSVQDSYIQNVYIDWPNFPTGNRDVTTMNGEGARLTHRYVDGVLMDGTNGLPAQPLWPWPMEDRIQAELGFSVTSMMTNIIASIPGN